ncbi:MAG: hypothetical protein PF569_04200 [Candidatus Woesearchaeota archaeon]|nr:hypothetical protein [Candidatus Woesearchaeota archaeon]
MALSFWIYTILFIVVVVLIFKFIKKIIAAVFTVIFLVILIFAGVGGLVYMDYKSIVEQENYNINLIYGTPEDPQLGLGFVVDENGFDSSNVESVIVEDVDVVFLDNLGDEDGFYIYVPEEQFESILDHNTTYYLPGTEDIEVMGFEVEFGLSKDEVLEVVNSEDSNQVYVDIVIENNDFPNIPGVDPESLIEDYIEEALPNASLGEVLFTTTFTDVDSEDVATIFEGFKDEEVEVYPDRFSFNIVKLLPVSTIVNLFSSDNDSEN